MEIAYNDVIGVVDLEVGRPEDIAFPEGLMGDHDDGMMMANLCGTLSGKSAIAEAYLMKALALEASRAKHERKRQGKRKNANPYLSTMKRGR